MSRFSLLLIKDNFEVIPRYSLLESVHENDNSVFNKAIILEENYAVIDYLTRLKHKPLRIEKAESTENVYFKRSYRHQPWWRGYWNINDEIYLESASAVVFRKINNHLFAITHGYGRSFLNPYAIVYDFGLRTAANLLDDSEIRIARLFTPSEIGLRTTKQSGKNTKVTDFDINIYNSMLKNIAGKVRKEYHSYFKTIDGADSICFSYSGKPDDLFFLADKLANIYSQEQYKKTDLYWIDNFKPIRDQRKKDQLDSKLLQEINERNIDILLLYPEEFKTEQDIYFKYSGFIRTDLTQGKYPDLDLVEQYYKFIGSSTYTNIREIDKQTIEAFDLQGGITISSYPVYHCLYYEFKEDGNQYFIEGGVWYSVDNDFFNEVEERFNDLDKNKIDFDFYYNRRIILEESRTSKKNKEYVFNKHLDEHLSQYGDSCLLDTKLVYYKRGKVEICDVKYNQDRTSYLIHNKYKYGSSSLSHLFSQGNVAAECLTDIEFIKKANEVISQDKMKFEVSDNIEIRNQIIIVYGIISKLNRHGKISVPIFSKINLKIFSDNLKRLGYKVQLSYFIDK